jgi:hypothetical protein
MQQISHSSAEIVSMEKESAILLLLKSAFLDSSDSNLQAMAEKIVDKLHCLPLAVDQAGAAIAGGLCRIGEYLGMYCRHHQILLDDPTFKGASDYGRAVYGTWDVSFTEIASRADQNPHSVEAQAAAMAIFTIQMFSFFHFQGITEEIFQQAAVAQTKIGALDDQVASLSSPTLGLAAVLHPSTFLDSSMLIQGWPCLSVCEDVLHQVASLSSPLLGLAAVLHPSTFLDPCMLIARLAMLVSV